MPPSPLPAPKTEKPLVVAVTGASGLVGTALLPALVARGHAVRALSRGAPRTASAGVAWASYDPADPASIARALDGADAVVHLAGENLFGARWRPAFQARIRASRVEATRALVAALASLPRRPGTLVSTSAVGLYGPHAPEDEVTERTPPAADFLGEVCAGWEAEAAAAERHGVRVAILRVGIVLARDGGALAKMAPPFRLFVGGPVAGGRQVMSWIHLDDLVGLYVRAVEDPAWRGPVNATAPRPVSNREFSKALGAALHRPSFLPTPGFALRLALGKVATLVTTGQRVLPTTALALGYRFRFERVEDALADLVGTRPAPGAAS